MVERQRNDVTDGVSWRCLQCKARKTIREGSFFHKSRLTLQKWLILMLWWAREYAVTEAAQEAEVDKNTAVDVYRWLREVCSTKLLPMPMVLGGPGVVVQIDESLFRHKPKVTKITEILLQDDFECNCDNNHFKQHLNTYIHTFRIIVEDQHQPRCGCSEWWTHHIPLL